MSKINFSLSKFTTGLLLFITSTNVLAESYYFALGANYNNTEASLTRPDSITGEPRTYSDDGGSIGLNIDIGARVIPNFYLGVDLDLLSSNIRVPSEQYDQDSRFLQYSIMSNSTYFISTEKSFLKPYVGAGFGFITQKLANIEDDEDDILNDGFAYYINAGFAIMVTPYIGLDLGYKLLNFKSEYTSDYQNIFSAGVRVFYW